MLKQAPTLSLLTILMACGGKQSSQGDEVLTWTKDIEPIVQQNCVRCHNPNGTGVGDFTNLDQVTAFAEVMRQQIESGAMPPPASDPSCRDYEGSDVLIMSEEDKARFSNWIDNGMPEGDPADGQTYDNSEYDLQDANLELMMQAPYHATFSKPQDNGNEYRCFALEHGQTEPFYITAMHPIVGNLKMSHHVIVGITDEAGLFPGSKDPEGVDCIAGASFADDEQGLLGGWAPGMRPYRLPEGVGIRVDPDDYIVLQLHYYQGDLKEGELTDQSGLKLTITDSVPQPAFLSPFITTDFFIPAGAESHTDGGSFTFPEIGIDYELTLWSMLPHMHAIGTGYESRITGDNRDTCLVQADQYDFDNQQPYLFRDPVVVNNGDTIEWSCTWNNSASNPDLIYDPPVDITWGEGSDDEMCLFYGLISEGPPHSQ